MSKHAHLCGLNDHMIYSPDLGCGHVFVHDGDYTQGLSKEQYARAHRCPNCARGDWRMKLPATFTYADINTLKPLSQNQIRAMEALEALLGFS